MLQRLDSFLDEELLLSDGLWSHDQLERMNQEFTAAVERALELGLESRAAARATVRVGREAAIESALEAAWNWLCCKKGDVSASEIMKFVCEPGSKHRAGARSVWS